MNLLRLNFGKERGDGLKMEIRRCGSRVTVVKGVHTLDGRVWTKEMVSSS